MNLTLCQKQNCLCEATHGINLAFRTTGSTAAAKSMPFLNVCEAHSKVTIDDVMDDAGWDKILDNFRKAGLKLPVRTLCYVEVKPLKGNNGKYFSGN